MEQSSECEILQGRQIISVCKYRGSSISLIIAVLSMYTIDLFIFQVKYTTHFENDRKLVYPCLLSLWNKKIMALSYT